jgi:hypothetical protein
MSRITRIKEPAWQRISYPEYPVYPVLVFFHHRMSRITRIEKPACTTIRNPVHPEYPVEVFPSQAGQGRQDNIACLLKKSNPEYLVYPVYIFSTYLTFGKP